MGCAADGTPRCSGLGSGQMFENQRRQREVRLQGRQLPVMGNRLNTCLFHLPPFPCNSFLVYGLTSHLGI